MSFKRLQLSRPLGIRARVVRIRNLRNQVLVHRCHLLKRGFRGIQLGQAIVIGRHPFPAQVRNFLAGALKVAGRPRVLDVSDAAADVRRVIALRGHEDDATENQNGNQDRNQFARPRCRPTSARRARNTARQHIFWTRRTRDRLADDHHHTSEFHSVAKLQLNVRHLRAIDEHFRLELGRETNALGVRL